MRFKSMTQFSNRFFQDTLTPHNYFGLTEQPIQRRYGKVYLIEDSSLDFDAAVDADLQKHLREEFYRVVGQANKELAKNIIAACKGPKPLLSSKECSAAGLAPARTYGRALERMVARKIKEHPQLSKQLKYTGKRRTSCLIRL